MDSLSGFICAKCYVLRVKKEQKLDKSKGLYPNQCPTHFS